MNVVDDFGRRAKRAAGSLIQPPSTTPAHEAP